MLVHAVREALGRHGAVGILLLVGIVVALLLFSRSRSLGVGSLAGATAAEETTKGMADGGSNGDTAVHVHKLVVNNHSFHAATSGLRPSTAAADVAGRNQAGHQKTGKRTGRTQRC